MQNRKSFFFLVFVKKHNKMKSKNYQIELYNVLFCFQLQFLSHFVSSYSNAKCILSMQ